MKKVLVAIVAIAMLVSMFSAVSNAADYMGKCFDGAFLTNNDKAATHVPSAEEKDVKSGAEAGALGSVYELGYSYIHFQGWLTDNDEFTDIGYQVNGGDIVWGIGNYDAAIIGATGGTYALRFNFNVAIAEGEVTIKFVEKLAICFQLLLSLPFEFCLIYVSVFNKVVGVQSKEGFGVFE